MLQHLTGRLARLVVLSVGVGAAVLAGADICPAVTLAAAVVAALVMVVQFFGAGPRVVSFSEEDWRPGGDGLVLEVPWRRHLRLWPNATVWHFDDSRAMQQIICDVPRGHTIVISISESPSIGRFAGEVRIS
jgi:hypothetical protein